MKLTFYTKPDCKLCDAAWFVVVKVAGRFGLEVERVDISAPGQERWKVLHQYDIPVVCLDGQEVFRHRVSEKELRSRIEERLSHPRS